MYRFGAASAACRAQRLRAGGRRRRADRSAGRPDRFREEFIARRALIVEGLNAIPGVSCVMPHGAFYAFPNMSSFGRTSAEVADHLLYGGRLRAGRHRLRPPRRGLPALQLRQQSREHQPRRRAHRRVAGAPEQHR